jgi:uncharacterized protein involved in outer membrane biogenesis
MKENFIMSTSTRLRRRIVRHALLTLSMLLIAVSVTAVTAAAQSRRSSGGIFGNKLVDVSLGEVTLERIDFQNQTAQLSVRLDITNALLPVQIKDFDYRLSLFNNELIKGSYAGTMRVGGKRPSRVNLPVSVNLRSIPSTLWAAFTNRGQVSYNLDTAFTVPLYITERRFDQSFSGEVPLRSVVDAATIMRAQRSDRSRLGDIFSRQR